jgi:hypothetical protein
MIQRFLVVRCDKCYRRYGYEFNTHDTTSGEAIREVLRAGWAQAAGNKVHCSDCKEVKA